jgi:hypothetical protein
VSAVGDAVLVRGRTGGLVEQGWWRTWGGGWSATRMPARLTRIYLAPDGRCVERLVAAVVGVLAEATFPWLVKVGAEADMLGRPDGMVVYLPDEVAGLSPGSGSVAGDAGQSRGPVDGIPDGVVGRLVEATSGLVADRTPPLTAPLAPGLAWCEDPGDGSSFGERICQALAALFSDVSVLDRADVVDLCLAGLAAAGLNPAAPYLRALSEGAAA